MWVCVWSKKWREKGESDGDEIETVKVEERKKNSNVVCEGKRERERERWFDARCEIASVWSKALLWALCCCGFRRLDLGVFIYVCVCVCVCVCQGVNLIYLHVLLSLFSGFIAALSSDACITFYIKPDLRPHMQTNRVLGRFCSSLLLRCDLQAWKKRL